MSDKQTIRIQIEREITLPRGYELLPAGSVLEATDYYWLSGWGWANTAEVAGELNAGLVTDQIRIGFRLKPTTPMEIRLVQVPDPIEVRAGKAWGLIDGYNSHSLIDIDNNISATITWLQEEVVRG